MTLTQQQMSRMAHVSVSMVRYHMSMFDKRFRSGRMSRTTATVTLNGKAVGHLGMMAGGSCCFVNASTVDQRLAFVAHADNLDAALVELNKAAAHFGLRAE